MTAQKHNTTGNLRCLIVANGEPLPLACVEGLASEADTIFFLDGAANVYLAYPNLWPKAILGDLDSIWPASKKLYTASGVSLVELPDQDHTDLEKAIIYCDEQGFREITVINALGRRTDHLLGNISFLKKYYRPERSLMIKTEWEVLQYLPNSSYQLEGKPGDACSLIGFPLCRVTSHGLAYNMTAHSLELGVSESICNNLSGTTAQLKIEGAAICIRSRNTKLRKVSA